MITSHRHPPFVHFSFFRAARRFALVFLVVMHITLFSSPAYSDSGASALVTVQTTIDGIIEIVQANDGDAQKAARRAKLRELINPVFDFDEMARRSLGSHWREATAEEQTEFVEVFSNLLAKTYLGKIETVKPGMVTVDQEQVDPPKAVVKTTVMNKGDSFPIDYKLQNTSGSWRVYDVVVENIGLVANYRNEFAGVIRKEKISGLIERLKNKQEE